VVTVSETYNDRKMLKWLPFEALEAQGEMFDELYDAYGKEERPLLSEDQCAAMQYAVEEAYLRNKPLRIRYFEHGRRHEYCGKVTNIDPVNACLFLDGRRFALENLLDAEL